MPNASAPNAPWVAVWLSPQTIVMPGCVTPSSGPITWTMPWRFEPSEYSGTPNSAQLRSSVSTCTRLSSSRMRAATGVPSVGTLWSAVASVRSGRRTVRPLSRSPSNACGLVTSWTRCRSMYSRLGATSWSAQILSNSVLGIRGVSSVVLAAAQAGGDDREQRGVAGTGVLEVVRQVGVEGDAVALREVVAVTVDVEDDAALLDEGDLAAAGLVHRRVAGAARAGAGAERVAAELGPLTGQRRGEDLEGVALLGRAAAAALLRPDDRHGARLVEAQELAEAQLEPGGDTAGDLERRARLAALDLAEHRGADARAQRQVAQREVHRLAQGAHARPDVDGGVFQDSHDTDVRYRIQACKRAAHGAGRVEPGGV